MLFTLQELDTIEGLVYTHGQNHEEALSEYIGMNERSNDDAFAEDMLHCATVMEDVENILKKIKYEVSELSENVFVNLDADHQGELLVLCNTLLNEWQNSPEVYFDGVEIPDMMYTFYLLGNIEGRLKSGRVTSKDVEMLDAWKEEMEA